jgi:hypothetical protein
MSKITASNSELRFKVKFAICVRPLVIPHLWVLEGFAPDAMALLLQGLMSGEAELEILV